MSGKIQMRNVSKKNTIAVPVTFDGGLLSTARAQMVNELLKYFLFERQQIPVPFEQVKQDLHRFETIQHTKKPKIHQRLEMKKAKDVVAKLQEIFVQVIKAFELCPEIQKAAIVLGATAMTPKETFVIEMPPLSPDADNLSFKVCIQSLFRQLMLQDPLGNEKQITPTCMTLLLHAPRNSSLTWFYPKPSYHLAERGKQFCFKFQNNCAISKHDLSHDYAIVDLSGFEPLDVTTDDAGPMETTESSSTSSVLSDRSISSDFVCITSENLLNMSMESESMSNTTPTNCSSTSVSSLNRTPTTSSKTSFNKTSSTSSILSQTSIISQSSDSNRKTNDISSCSSQSRYEVELLNGDEFIWFQAPHLVKGYKCKLNV